MKHLYRTQLVNAPIDQVWEFFSQAKNLKELTPEYMNMHVTSQETGKEIYPGQVITYTLTPLLSIPVTWATEITQVVSQKMFVDNQIAGPYSIWHHQHHFETTAKGVLMTDEVNYLLPLGPLGNLIDDIFLRKQLEGIFDYRYRKVDEIFNGKK